jgi:hypothetical protein
MGSKGNQGPLTKNRRDVREGTREKAPGGMRRLPTGAAELGSQKGDHVMDRRRAAGSPVTGFSTAPGFQPCPLGNTITVDKNPGPGSGRTTYEYGTQCQTPVPRTTGKGGRF